MGARVDRKITNEAKRKKRERRTKDRKLDASEKKEGDEGNRRAFENEDDDVRTCEFSATGENEGMKAERVSLGSKKKGEGKREIEAHLEPSSDFPTRPPSVLQR